MLTSTVITVLVFDVTLRIGGYMPQYALKLKELKGDRATLRIVLNEDYLYRVKEKSRNDINNFGYRGSDFSHNKIEGRQRILLLGDSFIMANNLTSSNTIPAVLEQHLGKGFEVLNMGISGYGPDQAWLRFLAEGSRFKPDFLVLALYAGNDFRDVDKNGLFKLANGKDLERTESNLVTKALPLTRTQILLNQVFRKRYLPKELEDQISAAFIQDKTELMSDPLSEDDEHRKSLMAALLIEIDKKLSSLKIPHLFMIIPALEAFEAKEKNRGPGFINESTLLEICMSTDIPCLDLVPEFIKSGGKDLYDPAYRHTNKQGAAVAAGLLANGISKLLPK